MKNDIAVVVPCLNAENDLQANLVPFLKGRYRVLIVDSESDDNTAEVAVENGFEVLSIKRNDFSHGVTRELARKHLNVEIVVYLTQDIVPCSHDFIEELVLPLREKICDMAYGKQHPRKGASVYESFPRKFNYGEVSSIRSIEDVHVHGVYTFFCSDSFAAYRCESLDNIGGIVPVYTNEDYFTAAKLLLNGGKIKYVSDARVIHSHDYSLLEEFRRNFDNGMVRAENKWVDLTVGNAEKRGAAYSKSFLIEVWREKKTSVAYAILVLIVKYFGFRLGYIMVRAPKNLKRQFSGQRYHYR